MILINLLPYREAAHKSQARRFNRHLAFAVLLGCLVSAVAFGGYRYRTHSQWQRNEVLQQEIARLDAGMKNVANLQKNVADMQVRERVMESLQLRRNLSVHLLQELVLQTPDGVHLSSLKQDQQHMLLTGFAQSQERVSELLNNLGSSDWLSRPELVEIAAISLARPDRPAGGVSSFTIRVGLDGVATSGAAKDARDPPKVIPDETMDKRP